MLARIVYPVLVLNPRRVGPEFSVLGSKPIGGRFRVGTGRPHAGGSPPKPESGDAVAWSQFGADRPARDGTLPYTHEDRLDAELRP